MQLVELAKKAAKLPDLEFDWTGKEQWNEAVFDNNIETPEEIIKYIKALKGRVSEQSRMLHGLTKAYMKLKDIILEAEIGE